jgi:FkbM family methyltransferase
VVKNKQFNQRSVIDAGANIGNHSIYFSKIYQKVFSFERNPSALKLLKFNSELYTKNIEIFLFGLSDQEGFFKFSPGNGTNIGGAYFINNMEQGIDIENIEVEVKKLDSITELHKTEIGLFKIDVEGLEFEVLHGGNKIIERINLSYCLSSVKMILKMLVLKR